MFKCLKKWLRPVMFVVLLLGGISYGGFFLASHPYATTWEREGTLIRNVAVKEKIVALTFDDGPDPVSTPLLLDILRNHQAQATFFVVGSKVEKYPQIIRLMAADGHEIANHSYSHADFNRLQKDQILEEIRKTNQLIEQIGGQSPHLFRPPGGYLSHEMVDLTLKEGMVVAYWTWQQDSKDWRRGNTAAAIAAHIVKNIRPGQIIILHDAGQNGLQTANAVKLLLEKLQPQGYRFVSMGELVKRGSEVE